MRLARRLLSLLCCALLATVLLALLLHEEVPSPAPATDPGAPGVGAETPSLRGLPLADGAPVVPHDGASAGPGREPAGDGTWRVVGTIRRADGAPVEDATVALTLVHGSLRKVVASVAVGSDGRYGADLPAVAALPPVPRATVRLVAHATAPGHRPSREAEAQLPLAVQPREVRLDLVLEEGGVLRGRVLNVAGRPVADAWTSAEGPEQVAARTDAEGRYVLGIRQAGSWTVSASVPGAGTGRVEGLRLDPATDSEAPDLVLRGEGTLAGQAVYPDGRTASDVRVYAFFAEGDPDAAGIGFATTTSDLGGRFSFAGLRPGRWVLGAWGRPRDGEAAGTWATGVEDARVIVDRAALYVRVLDAEGNPVPGASYILQGRNELREFSQAGTVEAADGVVAIGAAPGTHVRFTASVGENLKASVEVTLEEGRRATRVDAVLGAERPPTGRLRVWVEGPAGARVRTFTASLRREGERMRMVEHSFLVPEDDEGLLPPVPPGRYVVEIRPGLAGLRAPPVALWFPVEAPAEVRAGDETVLRAVARPGGRLRVTVRLPEGAPAPGDLRAEAAPLGGGSPHWLHSFVTQERDAWTVSNAMTLGVPNVAAPVLEAGRYTVRVTAAGHRSAGVVVDVVAGEITDVETWLEPS